MLSKYFSISFLTSSYNSDSLNTIPALAFEPVLILIDTSFVERCCTGVGTAGAATITGIAITAGVADAIVIGADDGDSIGLSESIRGCYYHIIQSASAAYGAAVASCILVLLV